MIKHRQPFFFYALEWFNSRNNETEPLKPPAAWFCFTVTIGQVARVSYGEDGEER
ncbi:MAG: hypothetical protein ABIG61_07340 [Planctomycetota bacterium]